MRRWIALIGWMLLALGSAGCSMIKPEARYVYQDHESGVIAIEKNTPEQMANAIRLMDMHFPAKNYEIVRAVEVEEGDRTIYESKNVAAEFDPAIATALRSAIVGTGKLSRQVDESHADKVKITECRIVYKRRDARISPTLAFAETSKYMPECYADPMATTNMDCPKLAKATAPKTDSSVVTTSVAKPAKLAPPSPPPKP